MELQLFYAYLKFLKENNKTFWQEFKSMIKAMNFKSRIVFVLMVFSMIASVVFSFFKLQIACYISLFIFIFLLVVFCITFNNVVINQSKTAFMERKAHCLSVLEWLRKFDINTAEEIQMYKDRIEKRIVLRKEENNRIVEIFIKIMQIFIIPIIVAAYNFFINRQTSTYRVMVYTCVGLILVGAVCWLIYVVRSMILTFQKFSVQQMQRFANDLQGALDCMKYVNAEDMVSSEMPEK